MNLKRIHFLPDTKIAGMLIGLTALAAAVGCSDLQSTDLHGASLSDTIPQNADTTLVTGILQNVDSVSGEVTVQLNNGTTTTFNLEDVNIEELATIAGSAILQAGDQIELMLGSDNLVASMAPSVAKIEGTIFNIDTDESSLTVDTENGVQLTVNIDEQTEIKAKGTGISSANIFKLVAGMEVKVIYDAETSQSSMIQFTRPEERGISTEQDRIGIVSSVDPIAHTITLSNSDGTLSTFAIASSTQIDDNGPVSFAAIQPGAAVEIEFNPITMEAFEVEIEDSPDVDEADEPDVDEVEDEADELDLDEDDTDELDVDEDEADELDLDEDDTDELDVDEDEDDELDLDEDDTDEPDVDEDEADELDLDEDDTDELDADDSDDSDDDGTDNSGHNDHEGDVDNSGPGNHEDRIDDSDVVAADELDIDEDDTDEPDVDEVEADELDIDEDDTDEPDVDEVEADELDIDEDDTDEPDVDEVEADELDLDEDDTDEPDVDEVEADELDIDEDDTDEPDVDEVEVDELDTDEDDTDEPDVDDDSDEDEA